MKENTKIALKGAISEMKSAILTSHITVTEYATTQHEYVIERLRSMVSIVHAGIRMFITITSGMYILKSCRRKRISETICRINFLSYILLQLL